MDGGRGKLVVGAVATLLALGCSAAPASADYVQFDRPYSYVQPIGVNSSGVVLAEGSTDLANPNTTRAPFTWNGAFTQLPAAPAAAGKAAVVTTAVDINDQGRIAGLSAYTNPTYICTFWQNRVATGVVWSGAGVLTELGGLPPSGTDPNCSWIPDLAPVALNGAGVVLGRSRVNTGEYRTGTAAAGSPAVTQLPAACPTSSETAVAINDAGTVVLQCATRARTVSAAGIVTDLPVGFAPVARGITPSGVILGRQGGIPAKLTGASSVTLLQPLPGFASATATAIADDGTVVGSSGTGSAARATLWRPDGTAVDLNTMAPGATAPLTSATDISPDGGYIIGSIDGGGGQTDRPMYRIGAGPKDLSVTLDAPVAASGDLVSVRLTATNAGTEPLTDVVFPSGMGVARDTSAGGTLAGLQPVFAPTPGFGATIAPKGSVTHTLVLEITAPGAARLVTRVRAKGAGGSVQTADAALRIDADLRPADGWETRQAVAGMLTQLGERVQEARARAVKRLVDAVRRDLRRNPRTRGMLKASPYEKALAQQHGLPEGSLSFVSNLIRKDAAVREGIVPRKPSRGELLTIFASEGLKTFLPKVAAAVDTSVDTAIVTPFVFWRDYARGVWNGQEGAINAEIADAAAETYTKSKSVLGETAKFYASEEERKYLERELPKIYDEAAKAISAYKDRTEVDLIKWDDLMQRNPRKAVSVFAGKLGEVEGFVAGASIQDLFDPVGNAQKALGTLRKGAKAGDLGDVVDAVTPPGEVTERLAQRGAQRIVRSGTAPARTPIKGMGNLNEDQLDFLSDTVTKVNKKWGVDIEIQARPVNAYSANIKDGIGKVEAVPTKNLTPDDVLMGAPEDWLGQTAYYKPKLPKGFDKLKDVDKRRIQLRYDEKLKEFQQFKGLKPDPTGKAEKVKKMLKPGGADVDLGQNYKGRIELAAIEREGATLIQYKKLIVNGNPVFRGKPRPIVSDIDFNAVVDRLTGKNLPAGIRGQVELELMNEFSKAQRSGLIPFGFHGWTHSGFDAKSKDFRYIAKYMLMYATDEQALRFARRWAPKFFPELGQIADPRKFEREYRKAVEAILDGYTRGKHLVKITADGASIGPGVDPTVGLPLP